MPDIPYKVPGTGETRYRHITSGQQRLMSKLNWEQTVHQQRSAKILRCQCSWKGTQEQLFGDSCPACFRNDALRREEEADK